MDAKHTLVFRNIDADLFESIRSGSKRFEVRAYLPAYAAMEDAEYIWFALKDEGAEKIAKKKLLKLTRISSTQELLEKFNLKDLDPNVASANDYLERLISFPGYADRIKQGGLLVFELE